MTIRRTHFRLDALNRTAGTLYLTGTRVTNTFDAAGLQLTMQDLTVITNYSYDLAGRQISVAYPPNKTLTYAYDPNSNRVLLTDPDSGLTTYTWDPENRLTQVLAVGVNAQVYTYSADGHRQQKQSGANVTYFTWDQQNVLQEANASLVTTVAYVRAPGVWGGLIRQAAAQAEQYFGFDFQGSTRLVVRPNGTVVDNVTGQDLNLVAKEAERL